MDTEGKGIVVDMLLRGTLDMLVDLHLLVSSGGQVRTEAEFRNLLDAAGLARLMHNPG